jgi:hypothetical protein
MHAWVYWLGYVHFLLDVPHYKIPHTLLQTHNMTKLIIPQSTHLPQKETTNQSKWL